MSDYDDPINTYEYRYRKPVYYTSPFSVYTTNVVVKLVLNSDNFNFNLANDDGSDFRLLSGLGVLKMWKAYWSKDNKHAVLFFKLPYIGGDVSIILDAYWGNSFAINISDPAYMGFLFYEEFGSPTISTSKWSGSTSAGYTAYGYLLPQAGFTSITDPLVNRGSWILEAGIYAGFSATPSYGSDKYWAAGFGFIGTENNFNVGLMPLDRIKTNAIPPNQESYAWSTKSYGGLEPYSYQDIHINYYEPDDRITVKLQNRNFYEDVEHQIWRKVEGDTRLKNIKIIGQEYYGAYPTYISWLVLREYNSLTLGNLDGRDLYVPYAYVPAQVQDYRTYLPDFTNTQYQHETTGGGNPYLLSDEGFDADSNVLISNEWASLSGIELTIHTVWEEDITSIAYIHYDSGHDYYYNASKLSNNNMDKMGRDYWSCTTTSGWAAIKFSEYKSIGAFRIKSVVASTAPSFYSTTKFNTISMSHVASNTLNGSVKDLSDGIASTYWQTYFDAGTPEWVSIDLGVSKNIWKICLTGHQSYDARMPRNFRIEGSADNSNWTIVYIGVAAFSSSVDQFFIFDFLSTPYRYWRLYVMDNWGEGLLILSKFELYDGNHAYSISVEGSPKDFIFYGSNLNPALYFDKAIKIIEGTFENTTEWQSRVISNSAVYKYYILNILNTYGDKNIKIQEWEMMYSLNQTERKYPTQLRLHPALYSNWAYNFPKEISLLGSIDSINWTTLMPWTYTCTPFMRHYEEYGYWQRYSFNNTNGFWSFKLLCRGNWEADDNKIIIGEWSLHELEEESYTYRILDGTTNNIQQIWATVNCGIDDKYSIIFISNDKMSRISDNRLVDSSDLPTYYEDFNVV
jgi:hypothetical protein